MCLQNLENAIAPHFGDPSLNIQSKKHSLMTVGNNTDGHRFVLLAIMSSLYFMAHGAGKT